MPVQCTNEDCSNRISGRPEDEGSTLCEQCQKSKDGESIPPKNCDTCHGIRYIESEVLMYVQDLFSSNSAVMMKKTIVSHFVDNEVREAKDILWEVYGDQLLGKYQRRNHQPDNPNGRREKEAEDILAAFSVIDRSNSWKENIKFCVTKMGRLPKYSPEEVNVTSLLDRVVALEQQISDIKVTTTTHTGQITTLNAEVSTIKINTQANHVQSTMKPTALFSDVLQQSARPNIQVNIPNKGVAAASAAEPLVAIAAAAATVDLTETEHIKQQIVKPKSKIKGASPRRTPGGIGQRKITPQVNGGVTKHTSRNTITTDMVQKALQELPEGFEYPRKYRKKVGVIGNKEDVNINIHGAPKCKVMFVHHVSNDTLDDHVKQYIEQNVVPVHAFEKASNPAAGAKSYKVKVLASDAKKMLDANIWPSGIGCNYWKHKKSSSVG